MVKRYLDSRNSNYWQDKLLKRQQECPRCGRKTAKALEYYEVDGHGRYEGNGIVVSKKQHSYTSKHYTVYSIWDGESYRPFPYGNFDRYKCAVDFANDIVNVHINLEGS